MARKCHDNGAPLAQQWGLSSVGDSNAGKQETSTGGETMVQRATVSPPALRRMPGARIRRGRTRRQAMIKAVLLDIDGTLMDTNYLTSRRGHKRRRRSGIPSQGRSSTSRSARARTSPSRVRRGRGGLLEGQRAPQGVLLGARGPRPAPPWREGAHLLVGRARLRGLACNQRGARGARATPEKPRGRGQDSRGGLLG